MGARDPFAAKFRTGQFCHADGRALLLDFDILIRADAPSPFDLVPPDHMAGVANHQAGMDDDQESHQIPSWLSACRQLGRDVEYRHDRYLNGGFILFGRRHLPVLHTLDRMMTDTTGVNEQAAWGVMACEVPFTLLSHTWNRVGPAVWNCGPTMTDYLHHFAGYKQHRREHKAARMAATDWRLTP